jgi:ATP-binding protein involved in chromosome partitioning
MTNPLTRLDDLLRRIADTVLDPVTGEGLAKSGRIAAAVLVDGVARITLEAPPAAVERFRSARDALEAAVAQSPGVERAFVVLTAHQGASPSVRVRKGDPPHERSPAAPPPRVAPPPRFAQGLPGVTSILAVASAKGGVGKSTVAVNLACAFAARGLRTGLLDLDVYGPSIPTLLGLAARKPASDADKKLIPLEAFGLKTMSIGYLVDIDAPMIWRGAMASSAVRQMFDDVAWGALDLLVLDMPPGTGDVQLTIAQRAPLAGAVIVSTPQEIALADVRRGIVMFEKTHVPVLGVIENMAWLDQGGGRRLHLFGEGGARRTAEAYSAPFLGELPIEMALRESADAGAPLVAAAPESPMAARFLAMAERLEARIAEGAKPPPMIRFV